MDGREGRKKDRSAGCRMRNSILLLIPLSFLTFLSIRRISFSTDWISLAPPSRYLKEYREIEKSFKDFTPLFVVVEGWDREKMEGALEEIAKGIREREDVDVEYRMDVDYFLRYGVYLIPDDVFEQLLPMFQERDPLYPVYLINRFSGETASGDTAYIVRLIHATVEFLEGRCTIRQYLCSLFLPDTLFFSPDGRLGYMVVYAEGESTEDLIQFAARVEKMMKKVERKYPGVHITLTGIPAVALEERRMIEERMGILTLAVFVLIFLLQVFFLRNLKEPLLMMISLIPGLLWSLFLVSLTIKNLNILTSMFIPIIAGLGIDFAIHLTLSYNREVQGKEPEKAVKDAIGKCGKGIVLGAVTTSFAFFSFIFSGFPMFGELGFIAGSGVLLCMLSVFLFLPRLLVIFVRKTSPPCDFPSIITDPVPALFIPLAFSLLFLLTITGLRFDNDLKNMQPEGLQSMKVQEKMAQKFDLHPFPLLCIAKTRKEAREYTEFLSDYGVVQSALKFLPEKEVFEKRKRVLMKKMSRSRDMKKELEKFEKRLSILSVFLPVPEKIHLDFKSLEKRRREFERYVEEIAALEIPDERHLPENIKERYINEKGEYLIYLFPSTSTWDLFAIERLVKEIEKKVPSITGLPIIMISIGEGGRRGIIKLVFLSLLFILILTSAGFRSIKYGIYSVLPVVLSILWSCGALSFLGMKLNFMNIMGFPLVLGIAVDDAIHFISRYLKEKDPLRALYLTGHGIILTTLTTVVGFGVLFFNPSRGLKSLGILLVGGFISACYLTLYLLPALFILLRRK